MARRTVGTFGWGILASSLMLLATGGGCHESRGQAPASAPVLGSSSEDAAPPSRAQAPKATAVAVEDRAAAPPAEAMAAARKLIRTGRLSIEVASFARAAEQATRLAEANHGYLADSDSRRSEYGRLRGSLTLRVPAERFGVLLEGLRALGTVQSENVGTQDVTKAYTDLETRLRVKRDTAERLRQILNTRAAKLSDVLEAERELARVTEEIETLEGERRFYDQQVALSTITAELIEPEPIVRSGFLDPIRRALAGSMELLGGSIAALLTIVVVALPWVLALGALVWLVRRLRGRRRGAPKSA